MNDVMHRPVSGALSSSLIPGSLHPFCNPRQYRVLRAVPIKEVHVKKSLPQNFSERFFFTFFDPYLRPLRRVFAHPPETNGASMSTTNPNSLTHP
jgi:hypothetical protein